MRARATIVAEAPAHAGGATRLPVLRSEAPLLVRQTPEAVYLVGGAAGPLGGDELDIDVHVGPHASLVVRSAAATLAQPGRDGGCSHLRTTLRVGEGASLSWRPEPLIAVRGCDHRTVTTVELAADASCTVAEELVLGRHDEDGGRVRSRLHVVRDGRTILLHDLDVGGESPHWRSGAVLGDARAVVCLLVVGAAAPDAPRTSVDHATRTTAAWLPFAERAAMLLALAPSLPAARRAVAAVGAP